MQWIPLQMFLVGFVLSMGAIAAAQESEGVEERADICLTDARKQAGGADVVKSDLGESGRQLKKESETVDGIGRSLGLGIAGTRYKPGSYGSYGNYFPGYSGLGAYGSRYGAYGGYGGYGTANVMGGLPPYYSGLSTLGSGFQTLRSNISPRGLSFYPGSYSVPNSYPSAYPGHLGGVSTSYRG